MGSASWSGVDLGNSPFKPIQWSNSQKQSIDNPFSFGSVGQPGNGLTPQEQQNQNILNWSTGQAGATARSGQQAIAAAQGGAGAVYGAAGQLRGLGSGIANEFKNNGMYADQALRDAFDPQGAAMKEGMAATQDQTGGYLQSAGLGSTGYGASIQAGAAGNFMNNWRSAQIGRENAGAQTATALQGQRLNAQNVGGQMITAAGQLDQGAMNSILSAYGLNEQAQAAAGQQLASIFGSLSTSTQMSA